MLQWCSNLQTLTRLPLSSSKQCCAATKARLLLATVLLPNLPSLLVTSTGSTLNQHGSSWIKPAIPAPSSCFLRRERTNVRTATGDCAAMRSASAKASACAAGPSEANCETRRSSLASGHKHRQTDVENPTSKTGKNLCHTRCITNLKMMSSKPGQVRTAIHLFATNSLAKPCPIPCPIYYPVKPC